MSDENKKGGYVDPPVIFSCVVGYRSTADSARHAFSAHATFSPWGSLTKVCRIMRFISAVQPPLFAIRAWR